MGILAVIIGVVGALFTLFAFARMFQALRRGGSRDLISGWFALMLVGGVVTFALLRVV